MYPLSTAIVLLTAFTAFGATYAMPFAQTQAANGVLSRRTMSYSIVNVGGNPTTTPSPSPVAETTVTTTESATIQQTVTEATTALVPVTVTVEVTETVTTARPPWKTSMSSASSGMLTLGTVGTLTTAASRISGWSEPSISPLYESYVVVRRW